MASISYIVTTYNRPQSLLLRAMQSIVSERLDCPNELIVVDDCSIEAATIPDSIIIAFGGQVQLIRNAQNKGFITSRNIGLIAAKYEYVLFLDDDDIAYPNRSRDLLASIEGTSYAFVAGRTRLFDNDDQYRIVPNQYNLPLTPLLFLCNMAHVNGFIWRRITLLDIGGFDNRVPYFGDQITPLLLILQKAPVLQIGAIVSQFQHISGGITQLTKYHNLTKQYLLELINVLLTEPLPIDFRHVCNEVNLFLINRKTSITIDEFLEYMNQQHNSVIPSYNT